MKIRIDVVLEFENGTTKDEVDEAMVEIYNKMWDHCTDVNIINEEEF